MVVINGEEVARQYSTLQGVPELVRGSFKVASDLRKADSSSKGNMADCDAACLTLRKEWDEFLLAVRALQR